MQGGDDVQVLKSFSFFPSHAGSVEVQCGVCEVELPIDCLDPYDIFSPSEQSVWAKGSSEEFHVRMSLRCHGAPMHSVPVRTRAPSAYDTRRRSVVWDELVSFPLQVRELTRDAELSMSVVGDGGRSVARARLKLFDEKGVLKQGLVKVALRDEDGSPPPREKSDQGGEYSELFEKSDHLFRADKLRLELTHKIERELEVTTRALEQQRQMAASSGDSSKAAATASRQQQRVRLGGDVAWLDELALARVVETQHHLSDRDRCLRAPHASQAERGMLSHALLILELPTFDHPVLWEEKPDARAPQIAPSHSSSFQRIVISSPSSQQQQQHKVRKKTTSAPPAATATTKRRGAISGPQLVVASSPGSKTPTLKIVERDATRVVVPGGLVGISEEKDFLVYDYEDCPNTRPDPIETKYRTLREDKNRALVDRALKPNVFEAKELSAIIASPSDKMTGRDMELVWRFRYTLKGNSKALPKFLLSVDWRAEAEVAQVRELLDDWPDRAPIDIADALKLLGPEKAFQHEVVRSFAVDALRSATDEELIAYLLQLVQALRYSERAGGKTVASTKMSSTDHVSPPNALLVAEAGKAGAVGTAKSLLDSGLEEEEEDDEDDEDDAPLATFLSQRACASLPVANFVWWYLNVGAEDTNDEAACAVFKAFKKRFAKDLYDRARATYETLKAQEQLIVSVLDAQAKARQEKGRRDHKQERLRALLSELQFPRLVAERGVPMPLDPTVTVRGLHDPKSTPKMYRSAMYPALISFERQEEAPPVPQAPQQPPPPPPLSPGAASPSPSDRNAAQRSYSAASSESYRGRIFPSQRKRRQELAQDESSKSILDTVVGSMFSFGSSSPDERPPAPPDQPPLVGRDSLPLSHDSQSSSNAAAEETTTASPYRVIVKNGDDLRQDQLVLQFVLLMDLLLKRVNLDLKLTCFRALATGANSGLIEFVEDSQAISGILADNHNSIVEFLKKHNPDDGAPDGVSEEAIDNFTKSTAGYCVITYLLGIGDRHLDNIMVCNNGCLFHIDFGFILGKDPKPYPPPFRLTKEMAEAMGYPDGANYTQKFKTKCCQAFNCLRKHAPLLLNLMSLMKDAGIEHLEEETALSKFQDRFRLDLGDEDAERFFLSLINESLNALVPVVLERFHKIAVWMK